MVLRTGLVPENQPSVPGPGRRPRRRRRGLLGLILVVVVLAAGALVLTHAGGKKAESSAGSGKPLKASDAVQARAVKQLESFTSWLKRNSVKGYIGEVGWPKSTDSKQWNAVGNLWYQVADANKLWVSQWTVGQFWGTTYELTPYQSTGPGWGGQVSVATGSASVLEAHPSTNDYLRGVNASGSDIFGQSFGTSSGEFCNTRPGSYRTDWLYDEPDLYTYLAARGVKLVRIGVRWERLQPTLMGGFDATEFNRLNSSIKAARAAGLEVVLDLHNYGAYWSCASPTAPVVRETLGSAALPYEAFADVWTRLSKAFKSDAGVYYGLMNEPVALESENGRTPAKVWETASQTALDAIRANGDNKLVMVAGYNWSSAANWATNHPTAWIVDPKNNFRYEAHQYFDGTTSGEYSDSYAQEVVAARPHG